MFRVGSHRVLWLLAIGAVSRTSAQGCYYPDGITLSDDQPCRLNGQQTSCCAAGAYCLGNGLCFDNGLLLRASCTDKTWSSPNCATVCVSHNQSEAVVVNPCSDNSGTALFACGLSPSSCQEEKSTFPVSTGYELVLQPSLQAQLAQSLHLASALPSSNTTFTAGALAGTAAGVALPLLIALGVTVFFLIRERKQRTRRDSQTRLTTEPKGYESLQPAVSNTNRPSQSNSAPSTPGLPHSPDYNSPLPSPGLSQPPHHSLTVHPPSSLPLSPLSVHLPNPSSPLSYNGGTMSSHRGPATLDAIAAAERPHSSGTSHAYSPHPGATPSAMRRDLSSATMSAQVPRLQPIHPMSSRDSIRSQATAMSNMPSPLPAHISSFAQRYEVMQQRAAIQTASAQQQFGLSTHSPIEHGQQSHEMDISQRQHMPPNGHSDYPSNAPHHYNQMMNGYSPVHGRAELDSDENRLVRHEMGDGRRSWTKQ